MYKSSPYSPQTMGSIFSRFLRRPTTYRKITPRAAKDEHVFYTIPAFQREPESIYTVGAFNEMTPAETAIQSAEIAAERTVHPDIEIFSPSSSRRVLRLSGDEG